MNKLNFVSAPFLSQHRRLRSSSFTNREPLDSKPLKNQNSLYSITHVINCQLSSSSPPEEQKTFTAIQDNGNHSLPQSPHVPSQQHNGSSSDEKEPVPRDLDVVITHSTADFDSLAAAVGLAKLRGPQTLVVTPGGESPSLRRFLTLHRQLFDIIDAKTIDPNRLRWIGIVDTVRKDRLGIAGEWPKYAHEVEIYDHHIGRKCDIENVYNNIKLQIEPVGAVCTIICEKLIKQHIQLTPQEATLLALAVHSDTGSLTFEHTTQRDAYALSWLLSQGALQRSISEYTQNFLSDEQQLLLSKGLSLVKRSNVHGVEIGCLILSGRTFLKGMSIVANDILDIGNLDVLIFAYINCRGNKAKKRKKVMDDDGFCGPEQLKQISIIGRARASVDGIDFNSLFSNLGGGGHKRAASASLKLTESDAENLIDDLYIQVKEQIPPAKSVLECMSTLLITVYPHTSLNEASDLMNVHNHQVLPVINENKVLLGLISIQDIHLARRRRGDYAFQMNVKSWFQRKVMTVDQNTPFYVAEKMVAENSIGMLPVVDDEMNLLGVITRTDVLVARRLWPEQLIPKQQYPQI